MHVQMGSVKHMFWPNVEPASAAGRNFSASDCLEPHRPPNQTRLECRRHIVSEVLYTPADSWLQTYLASFPAWLQNPTEKPLRGVRRGNG